MKKILLVMMAFLFTGVLLGCEDEENDKLKVAVTIVPQATFVDAVGGDLVEVITIIPVGFSPASYEPSAREIVNINKASIYFTLGVPAESGNIIPEVSDIPMIHLEDKVRDVYDDLYFDYEHTHDDEEDDTDHEEEEHSEFSRDPHIWLSVKRVKVMVQVIADELSNIDPDNAVTYQENASIYLSKLDDLDSDIQALFVGKTMRTFIVYHPSYGYFSDDYNLEMLALEEDGKDPSIAHLQELIDFARDNDIDRIYHQAEIDSERVKTFKNDINGISVKLYPLDYDYLSAMLDLATKIAEGLS